VAAALTGTLDGRGRLFGSGPAHSPAPSPSGSASPGPAMRRGFSLRRSCLNPPSPAAPGARAAPVRLAGRRRRQPPGLQSQSCSSPRYPEPHRRSHVRARYRSHTRVLLPTARGWVYGEVFPSMVWRVGGPRSRVDPAPGSEYAPDRPACPCIVTTSGNQRTNRGLPGPRPIIGRSGPENSMSRLEPEGRGWRFP